MPDERSSARLNAPKRQAHGTVTKLSSVSKGSKIQKRPLTRRQPPASSKSHIVYVSSRTPFMAAVQRVRKILDKAHLSHQNNAATGGKNASLAMRIQGLEREAAEGTGAKNGVEVLVTGTGRALEKVLGVAGWFEDQGDCEVEVRTGTVGTVDDVVDAEDGEEEEDSRVRKLSCLEVVVRLK